MGSDEVVHSFVREQRAAYRAIREAIDGFFSQGDDSPQALEALGKQVESLLRYAQAITGVVGLRGGVGDLLQPEGEGEEPDEAGETKPTEGLSTDERTLKLLHLAEEAKRVLDMLNGQEAENENTAEAPSVATPVAPSIAKGEPKRVAQRYVSSDRDAGEVDVSMKRKPLKSLEKGMTINDRLYFRQELCGGDAESFKVLIAKIEAGGSLEASVRILQESLGEAYDGDSEGVRRFVKLLEQRYGS